MSSYVIDPLLTFLTKYVFDNSIRRFAIGRHFGKSETTFTRYVFVDSPQIVGQYSFLTMSVSEEYITTASNLFAFLDVVMQASELYTWNNLGCFFTHSGGLEFVWFSAQYKVMSDIVTYPCVSFACCSCGHASCYRSRSREREMK